MICIECRSKNHEGCRDLPRLQAAVKKEIPGVLDLHSSAWCDCAHVEQACTTVS